MKSKIQLLGIAGLFLSVSLFVDAIQNSAVAQIMATPNDTVTEVNRSGNTLNIQGGTEAGKNLFHSFEKFGVEKGQTANFISNPEIENILGRVTGSDASVINGIIQVTGGNSNLYLMNPAGIIFGADASLNLPAAFTATTANGIGFGDKWFKAFGENDYASFIGNPDAFGFTQAGAILNEGNLAVDSGQNLTLLGGTVINTGKLEAPGGDITVAAVPEDKLVRITQEGSLLSLGLPTETKATVTNQSFTPLSLPKLLTGGNLSSATGVEVENGVVKLTGSGVEIPNDSGTIVVSKNEIDNNFNSFNAESKNGGGDISLFAPTGSIILDEVKLSAGRNLNLKAQSVTTADSFYNDNELKAGQDLILQVSSILNSSLGNSDAGQDLIIETQTDLDALPFSLTVGGNTLLRSQSGSITLDGETLSQENLRGDITLEANKDITVTKSRLEANRDLKLQAERNIILEKSQFRAVRDTNIISANQVEIKDAEEAAIVTTGRDLLIQGNEGINIEGFRNPDSILESGNNLILISDGLITANANFVSSGNFSTNSVEGDEGNFQQTIPNFDTIISSGGDVNFGNYEGLALKVEAKGSITGGDITIYGSNPNLTGSDPDIPLLTNGPGLVLRAGVEQLQNTPNTSNQNVGGTSFTSPGNSSSANITVGNIDTAVGGEGGSVTMSTTGNISTGNITTAGNRFDETENIVAGNIELVSQKDINVENIEVVSLDGTENFEDVVFASLSSETGKITVNTILVIGSVYIDAANIFQAKGTLPHPLDDFNDGIVDIPISIWAGIDGIVDIKHGGEKFTHGIGVEKDEDGKTIYRMVDDGRRVFLRSGDYGSNVSFVDEQENPITNLNVDENGNSIDADFVTVKSKPFDINGILPNESFTRGLIVIKGSDAGLYGVSGDTFLPDSENISVVDIPKPDKLSPNISSDTKSPGSSDVNNQPTPDITSDTNSPVNSDVSNQTTRDISSDTNSPDNSIINNQPTSNISSDTNPPVSSDIQKQPTPDKKVVQSQLNQYKKNNICSPRNSSTALNRQEDNRGETINSKAQSNNNPCNANDEQKNILEIIPDNRFDSNSALPKYLFELTQQ